jgi:hypothetical protein
MRSRPGLPGPNDLDALIAVAAWLLRALLVISVLGAAIACSALSKLSAGEVMA